VDGEIVALDDAGRPNFNFLQHSRSQASRICYFVFDLLIYENRDLTQLPLIERREILKSVLKFQSPRVRIAEYFETSAEVILQSAREQGLEGVIAKRKDSRYEAGKRSGAWAKFRINSGPRIGDWRLCAGRSWRGVHHRWLLPSIDPDLCGESPEWICAGNAKAGIRKAASASGAFLPIRESP
jgi:hypothetical protein